jgi:phospholipid/cholesterol/gamma-HCH transport system substrate-binding protein
VIDRRQLRATWRRILFRNVFSFTAMVSIFLLASVVAIYILDHQNVRLPILDEKAWTLKAEFTTAQAVVPGQGQTIRVSGIRIGDVTKVQLHNGRAIVTFSMDQKYRRLIHPDATALLRPKTGLKDMFVELNPGREGAPVPNGFMIPVANTLPDVNSDEVLASLDQETRDYLRMLVDGLGEGLKGRGRDFGTAMRLLEPTHRDLARVSAAVAERHRNLRRVIDHLAKLNGELSGHDNDLARLVEKSAIVFRQFASQERNISGTVRRFPPALRETTRTLGKVRVLADTLRPAVGRLEPAIRSLTAANRVVAPSARAVTPVLRDQIRPFTRDAQPLVRELRAPAAKLSEATGDFTRVGVVLNHLFNMVAYNPNGREGPDVKNRDEGYLFWLAWLGHQSVQIFNASDAHGIFREVAVAFPCNALRSYVGDNPEMEFILNLTPLLAQQCKPQTQTQAAALKGLGG